MAGLPLPGNLAWANIPQVPPPSVAPPVVQVDDLPVVMPVMLPNCALELRVDGAGKKDMPAKLHYFGGNAGTLSVYLKEAEKDRSPLTILIQADTGWYAGGRATINRMSSPDNDPAKLSAPILDMMIEIDSTDAVAALKEITIWDGDVARERLLVKKVKKKDMAKWKACAATMAGGASSRPSMSRYTHLIPNQSARLKNTSPLINSNDYPSKSLMKEEEGSTSFRLGVSRYGRVIDCDVMKSSGFVTLDAAACTIIMRRARFTPAADPAGKPISSSWRNRVRWVIPGDSSAPNTADDPIE